MACEVFVDEILRTRTQRGAWMPTAFVGGDEEGLLASLRDGMAAMSIFLDGSALMSTVHSFCTPGIA